ncbi:MAG: hypothetical protein O6704_02580 [Nitrospinae bacterium]|nr:hypothetical protein [Nitrospinota bacterium]
MFSAWLIGQFWPVPLNPSESEFRQTVLQKPVHGALDLQPDGRLVYRPGSGFREMDRFVLKTEYNENTITRTFLVTAAPPVPRNAVSFFNCAGRSTAGTWDGSCCWRHFWWTWRATGGIG